MMNKYNMNGPRYTSYPTALEFQYDFSNKNFCQAVAQSETDNLSIYIHIPFCHKLCYYCGCNKVVTRHKHKADIYLDYLAKEIESRASLFQDHKVVQIHFGGGTPSFLSKAQFSRIIALLNTQFEFDQKWEMSIEIDPREIELDYLDHLYSLGFTRLSFGVQDTNLQVQEAINRVQDLTFIKSLLRRARDLGFCSINLDVIYGLPHQSPVLFEKTLNDILDCDPDRISLFSYAHMPSRFAAQRKIKDEWLPTPDVKMSLMLRALDVFVEKGYIAIGMDHFAKPNDDLAQAQQSGQLHRNFQGYTTLGSSDLLGLGVSSISSIGNSFSQNYKSLTDYYASIDTYKNAVEKGLWLSRDDQIRGDVIKTLMCNFLVNISDIEKRWQIDFKTYFENELNALDPMIKDHMLQLEENHIRVTQSGKLFVRTICMTFDKYMAAQLNQQRFSRII
ncbi:oxygen-independent coproporphyrinogen III oxidase [Psychrosphaera sp. B3R10]|uniref:Coproporphyrinogen-III oxidase n=1 Tax=Psychrosphaera algicola TaxID=3023714 RepID=A0ABT5FFX5_9GAMM|nr:MULTISPECIES: oxygen-independent coproporphyrinogen III oxidase [unclassified Psychrosphaera]MBU2883377.1 oxygen-independent coproporphyrinogen III oxidase [Psychrosphaera sp. I2R16]MBU2990529.1 oxygen-independent coproporphyrinogen III oxidase [Psychrosphaera sp. B3R10]MDC2889783.1 oxygen-independent coproporphyrinogen III oxidase [Psychrosphaera sp. G1-22]